MKNNTIKKVVMITAIVIAALALFTLPVLLWPDETVARTISWPALFVEWLLHYITFFIGSVLSIGTVIFIAKPGNEFITWFGMVLLCFVFIGLSCLFAWVLLRAGFVVPFSGDSFVPIFGK